MKFIVAALLFVSSVAIAGPGDVLVKWDAGTPSTGATITGYEVFRNGLSIGKTSASVRELAYSAAPGTCLKASDTWTVKLTDSANLNGTSFPPAQLTADSCKPAAIIPPSPPKNIQLIISDASATANSTVTVKWDLVKTRVDGSPATIANYIVYLDAKPLATVTSYKSIRTIKAGQCLTTDNKYTVQAVAVDGSKSAVPESVPMPRTVCSPATQPCVPG